MVAAYAERLKMRGHEIFVVSTPIPPLSLRQKIRFLLKEKRWPEKMSGASYFDNIDIEHKVLESFRPITKNDVPDADVVIATLWMTAEWINAFDNSKGLKFYFIQGYELFQNQSIERIKSTYKLPLKKIVVSKWLMDIMIEEYEDKEVSLVPNSVDYNIFNAPERERQSTLTIGFMYSPLPFKGCDIIFDALKTAREKIPRIKIIAFGAKKPISQMPLPASTEFYYRPPQEKLRQIYSLCDIWLFGSRSEGFGLPILEALACRTPVIATPAGAAPELLSDGGGVLLGDFTVESMVKAITDIEVMSDFDWQTVSKQAYQKAKEYSWDDATLLFEKCLLNFLNSSRE
ncbi:glycosyltransferase family 4 protein [Thermodesulfobacteriota bacterium]